MQDLIQFVQQHQLLVSAFMAVGFIWLGLEWYWSVGPSSVTPEEAVDLMNHSNAVALDVREQAEFSKAHIINSEHVPLGSLTTKKNLTKRWQDKQVIVVAATTKQANAAVKQLKADGLQQVTHLAGGIPNWLSAGLPVAKQ